LLAIGGIDSKISYLKAKKRRIDVKPVTRNTSLGIVLRYFRVTNIKELLVLLKISDNPFMGQSTLWTEQAVWRINKLLYETLSTFEISRDSPLDDLLWLTETKSVYDLSIFLGFSRSTVNQQYQRSGLSRKSISKLQEILAESIAAFSQALSSKPQQSHVDSPKRIPENIPLDTPESEGYDVSDGAMSPEPSVIQKAMTNRIEINSILEIRNRFTGDIASLLLEKFLLASFADDPSKERVILMTLQKEEELEDLMVTAHYLTFRYDEMLYSFHIEAMWENSMKSAEHLASNHLKSIMKW